MYSKEWWREYRVKNADKLRAYKREYDRRMFKEHREREINRRKEWSKRNPIKQRAQQKVGQAVLRGKLKRLPCQVCGEVKVHAHHADYSKPLEVIWLCPVHHAAEHRRLRVVAH